MPLQWEVFVSAQIPVVTNDFPRPAISRMSGARVVGGRPDRRERRRQNARKPARCQRRMVAGWMSRVASRQAGAIRAAKTIVKRCQGVHMMRPAIFRSATMSCCRRSAFSATNSTRWRRDPPPARKRTEEGRSRVESYTLHAGMEFVAGRPSSPDRSACADSCSAAGFDSCRRCFFRRWHRPSLRHRPDDQLPGEL